MYNLNLKMKYVELKASVEAYRAGRPAREARARLVPVQSGLISEELRQREPARIHRIMRKLQIDEVLEAVRSEWGEGVIGGNDFRNATKGPAWRWLKSEGYPGVNFWGQGRGSYMELLPWYSFINVSVTPGEVRVSPNGLFRVDETPRDLSRLIREESDLIEGFRKGMDFRQHELKYEPLVINIRDRRLVEKFRGAVVDLVETARVNNSFPQSIRVWTTGMVTQLPTQLDDLLLQRTYRRVEPDQLRDWGYQLRGAGRLERTLHRIVG